MDLISKIMEFLVSAEGASATIAIVLEFAFRLIPTKKPLSVLHLVGKIAKGAGAALVKVGDILDKVLPQDVKE